MRAWKASVSDVTATSSYTPFEAVNFGDYAGTFTDSGGTVPASSPYKLTCDRRPKRNTIAITLNGVPAQLGEWPTAPATTGIVSVNYLSGELAFHSGDAGKTVAATYEHKGSVLDATAFHQIQKNLQKAQQDIATIAPGSVVDAAHGGTGQSSYAVGDTVYASGTTAISKLTGNTSTTRKFLRQVGTGSAANAPAWDTLQAGDMPSGIDAVKIGGGAVTNTIYGYISGLTSDVQTQLNGKAAATHTHNPGDISGGDGVLLVGAGTSFTTLAPNVSTTRKALTQVGDGADVTDTSWQRVGRVIAAGQAVIVTGEAYVIVSIAGVLSTDVVDACYVDDDGTGIGDWTGGPLTKFVYPNTIVLRAAGTVAADATLNYVVKRY